MTYGWDDVTAYGFRWTTGGRLGGVNSHFRLSARNSGLFYLRATQETQRMMARLKGRMEREAVWDQTAYNEEVRVRCPLCPPHSRPPPPSSAACSAVAASRARVNPATCARLPRHRALTARALRSRAGGRCGTPPALAARRTASRRA